jgi:cytochrome bd-type quinol oxidase subunit 2
VTRPVSSATVISHLPASSGHYTLQVMAIAALVLLTIILLYQAWTYHVFRARIQGTEPGTPLDALGPARS